MTRYFSVFLFLVFAVIGNSLAQDSASVMVVPCPFELPEDEIEGETIDCVVVTVPESRNGLSDNVIELAVVVLYANGEEQIDPILHLAGGPGNSGTAFIWDFADHPIREHASVILWDQRGTGYSYPSLDCTGDGSDEEVQACYDSLLEAGVVIDAYRTEENADDVNDIITALDLESINVYGISYGSRLALTVMKDPHPAIRSVILDGVYPPNVLSYVEDPINIVRVFQAIIDGCANDVDCNAQFPDLETVFIEAIDRLNEDPIIIDDPEEGEIEITGDDFIGELFASLYDTDAIPYAPALIYVAYNHDADAIYELLYADESDEGFGTPHRSRGDNFENDGNSEGMFNSLDCADEVPFNSLDGVEDAISELDLPPAWAEAFLEDAVDTMSVCDIWQVTPSDPSIRVATNSDLPTLIFSGDYDPVTPPNWAELAAETLSNSYVFIIPAGGHGVFDMSECTLEITYQFLLDPDTEPDGSCVEDMPPPQWFLDYP